MEDFIDKLGEIPESDSLFGDAPVVDLLRDLIVGKPLHHYNLYSDEDFKAAAIKIIQCFGNRNHIIHKTFLHELLQLLQLIDAIDNLAPKKSNLILL